MRKDKGILQMGRLGLILSTPMLPMHHAHSRMQVVAHIMSTDTTDLVCTRGHRRSCVGNRTSCEIGWSRGLMIVILTCAMIMPVYFPEHGGMSQRAHQPHPFCLFVFVPALFFGMRILPVPRHVLFGFVTRKRTFNSCFPFCGKCAGSVACTHPGLFIWTDVCDLAL